MPVFRGYPRVLVCEAEGNPKPEISWSDRNGHKLDTAEGNLTVSEFKDGDFYTCTASNNVSTTSRQVNMEIQGNYVIYLFDFCGFICLGLLKSYFNSTWIGNTENPALNSALVWCSHNKQLSYWSTATVWFQWTSDDGLLRLVFVLLSKKLWICLYWELLGCISIVRWIWELYYLY